MSSVAAALQTALQAGKPSRSAKAPIQFLKPSLTVSQPTSAAVDAPSVNEQDNDLMPAVASVQRLSLPIYAHRRQILYALQQFQVLILLGHTGCGKTTQVPQYLYEAGYAKEKMILCTQPRRIAATSVAQRVSQELNAPLGTICGYSIRFDDKTQEDTKIKYCTDALLLQELLHDPLLTRYSVVMVDEAHERTVWTDLLLGLLKKIMLKRKDLKVIVASATLDAEAFHSYFENSCLMSVQGKMYPLDLHYLQVAEENYLEKAIETVQQIHSHEATGDILVFLTGMDEIEYARNSLREWVKSNGTKLLPLPLYAGLSMDQQLQIMEPTPPGYRKCILSTNIAETSVTIDGIAYVIDCGYAKIRLFNPDTGVDALIIKRVSKAAALQRAGRAGRQQPGKVYRLYTREHYEQMEDQNIPEIQRCNLAPIVLYLKNLGIDSILSFPFLTPPPPSMLARALELLVALGALDMEARLTQPVGQCLADLPLDPMAAKMMLSASEMGCLNEALSMLAMITVQSPFALPASSKTKAQLQHRRFAVEEGDWLSLLNVYTAFIQHHQDPNWCHQHYIHHGVMMRAVRVRRQLEAYAERFGLKRNSASRNVTALCRCITAGYFSQCARAQPDGSYLSLRDNSPLYIHPNSLLFRRAPPLIVYGSVLETTKRFIKDICVTDESWLVELAPHYYREKSHGH